MNLTDGDLTVGSTFANLKPRCTVLPKIFVSFGAVESLIANFHQCRGPGLPFPPQFVDDLFAFPQLSFQSETLGGRERVE